MAESLGARGLPRAVVDDVYLAPVHLNVGGTTYTTTLTTLTKFPDSKLAKLFNGTLAITLDPVNRHYFLDVDGSVFTHILNFLRYEKLVLPDDFNQLPLLKQQVEFFELGAMLAVLTNQDQTDEESKTEEDNVRQRRRRRRKTGERDRDNEELEGEEEDLVIDWTAEGRKVREEQSHEEQGRGGGEGASIRQGEQGEGETGGGSEVVVMDTAMLAVLTNQDQTDEESETEEDNVRRRRRRRRRTGGRDRDNEELEGEEGEAVTGQGKGETFERNKAMEEQGRGGGEGAAIRQGEGETGGGSEVVVMATHCNDYGAGIRLYSSAKLSLQEPLPEYKSLMPGPVVRHSFHYDFSNSSYDKLPGLSYFNPCLVHFTKQLLDMGYKLTAAVRTNKEYDYNKYLFTRVM